MILGKKVSNKEEIRKESDDQTEKIETFDQNKKNYKINEENNENIENVNAQTKEEKNPPIFIKIDKYREILSALTEMKLLIHKIISNISVIQKVEEIELKAFENSKELFNQLDSKLNELNTYFMTRTEGSEESKNIPEIEELKKLEEEIEKLKQSLE